MNNISFFICQLWKLFIIDETSLLVVLLLSISINFDDGTLNNKCSVVRLSLNAFRILNFAEFIFFLPIIGLRLIFKNLFPFIAINLLNSIHISILFSISNDLSFEPVMVVFFLCFLNIFLMISFIQNFG
jgi:hypothetical protein